MSLKREVSESVSNLRQSVKRLALENSNLNMKPIPHNSNNENILINSKKNFNEIYEILNEIGRGGFSIVYKCKNILTNEIYAVKVYYFLFSFI